MRIFVIAAAVIAASFQARAADDTAKTMPIEQVIAVTTGLTVIGGCKDGSSAVNKTCELYELKPSVRWTIALDIARGREMITHYNEQCDAIAQGLGGQRCGIWAELPAGSDPALFEKQRTSIATFNKQVKELLASPSGLIMGHVKKADLNVKDEDPKANRFPADSLSMVLPIIDEQ